VKVHRSISELAHAPGPVVLAIGVFDGLHLGHRAVLESAQTEANRLGGTAVPLSFDPHPAQVLRPEAAPLLLTSPAHKLNLLKGMGFSHSLLLSFDRTVASTSPDEFIKSLVHSARPLAAICVGQEWSFGKGRQGNLRKLAQLGAQLRFQEIGVPEIHLDGEAVSSTRIRNAVALGNFPEAERLLGRPFSLLAPVQHGRALGRTIGFPTANLVLSHQQLPPNGVYAVWVRLAQWNKVYAGVANLGTRPTVDSQALHPCLEVHLFDFEGDLYEQTIEVQFESLLRDERKFESLEQLREQIQRDAAQARTLLTRETGSTRAQS
jgi:riboflavin kinase/FMN adenylyltransferase